MLKSEKKRKRQVFYNYLVLKNSGRMDSYKYTSQSSFKVVINDIN